MAVRLQVGTRVAGAKLHAEVRVLAICVGHGRWLAAHCGVELVGKLVELVELVGRLVEIVGWNWWGGTGGVELVNGAGVQLAGAVASGVHTHHVMVFSGPEIPGENVATGPRPSVACVWPGRGLRARRRARLPPAQFYLRCLRWVRVSSVVYRST